MSILLPWRNHSPIEVENDEAEARTLDLKGSCGHQIQLEIPSELSLVDIAQAVNLAEELPCGSCKRRKHHA